MVTMTYTSITSNALPQVVRSLKTPGVKKLPRRMPSTTIMIFRSGMDRRTGTPRIAQAATKIILPNIQGNGSPQKLNNAPPVVPTTRVRRMATEGLSSATATGAIAANIQTVSGAIGWIFQQVDIGPLTSDHLKIIRSSYQPWVHSALSCTPRRFWSAELVVVYCSLCFVSGSRYCWIAKAVRAPSWKPLRISFFLPG